jgi:hypothetical protein
MGFTRLKEKIEKNYFSSHKLPKQQSTNFWSQGILGVKNNPFAVVKAVVKGGVFLSVTYYIYNFKNAEFSSNSQEWNLTPQGWRQPKWLLIFLGRVMWIWYVCGFFETFWGGRYDGSFLTSRSM